MFGHQLAQPTRFHKWIWSLLGIIVMGTWVAPSANAQFGRTYGQPSSLPVFLPAPRELQRELTRAADDIEQENFVDAITRLDFILNGQEKANEKDDIQSEDFFLPARKGKPRVSIKQEADRLINSLPPKGRAAYELSYGTEAAQQLKQAIANRDYLAIGEISRRYGNTNAGEEATLLLGRNRLAKGDSVEAILHFQRLASNSHASERFGAELKLLHAMALQLSRRKEEAKKIIADVKLPANSPLTKNLDADNLNTLLTMVPSVAKGEDGLNEWPMFGGNLRRTGSTNATMPTRSFAWDLPNTDSVEQKKLADQAKKLHGSGITPVLHPILVGDWLLARSTDWLVGVPIKYGSREWKFPSWVEKNNIRENQRDNLIKTRVWSSSLYGQVSSDGEYAYVISNVPESVTNTNLQAMTNELVALEIAGEGKLKWIVGKDDANHEPALRGMFFLGPPLPIGDSLFCVGERNGEIRVMELRKTDGKLLWSQQLAHVESNIRDRSAGSRRLAGINLAFADGVLVCPTSTGGVIGIELSQHRFMWGHEYKPRTNQVNRRTSVPNPINHWRDNWAMIDNGRLVLTPWDSDEMFCLDLLTGENLWKQKVSRNGALYVAAIHNDQIIVVGKDSVFAISANDGSQSWRRSLRGGPSGRGIKTGSHYLLATTEPELIKINLDNGEIVDSIETIDALGNLVASEDMIISQNALWLRAFYQRDKLEARVERQLAKNPKDPWALEHQGVLLLEDSKRAEGVKKLLEAIANYPADEPGLAFFAKKRLVDSSFKMLLEDGGPDTLELARAIEPYLDSRKEEFLSVMTIRNQKEGRLLEAFQSNLQLYERLVQEDVDYIAEPKMKTFGKRQIVASRWHRSMFHRLWKDASDSQRKQMGMLVRQSLADAPEALRWTMLKTMQDIDFVHEDYLVAIEEQLLKAGKKPYVEGALLRLAKSPETTVAARATSLLAQLYLSSGQMVAAANQYRRLNDEFGEAKIDGDKSGAEITEALLDENAKLREHYETKLAWGHGLVKTARSKPKPDPKQQQAQPNYQLYRAGNGLSGFLPVASESNTDFQADLTWGVTRSGQISRLEIRDSLGQTISTLSTPFPSVRKGREPKVLTFGHLAVAVLSNGVVAMNGLQNGLDGMNSELWKKTSTAVGVAPTSQIRKINFGKLSSLSRRIETGPSGRSQISLGSVSDRGIVLRQGGDLVCLDPETGTTLWMRDDLRVEAEVWGDEEFVFVHVPERYPDGGGNARVFSVLDGTELESRPAPQQDNRVRAYGSHVLTWQYDVGGSMDLGTPITLDSPRLVDDIFQAKNPLPNEKADTKIIGPANRLELRNLFERTKRFEWSRVYGAQARATWVNHTELAVFDPDTSKLDVISVLDGEDKLSVTLEPEVRVDTLTVLQRGGLYLVIVGENSDGKINGKRLYRAPDSGVPLQNLEVYGFSTDGEMTWAIPARLKNFQHLPTNANGIPIVVFGRQTELTPNRSQRTFESVVLDTRDGHAAFTNSNTFTGVQRYEVKGHRDSGKIDLVLPARNGDWTLEFSDEPRAPSIPYGYAADVTKKPGQDIGSSILKTILPGTSAEEDINAGGF